MSFDVFGHGLVNIKIFNPTYICYSIN